MAPAAAEACDRAPVRVPNAGTFPEPHLVRFLGIRLHSPPRTFAPPPHLFRRPLPIPLRAFRGWDALWAMHPSPFSSFLSVRALCLRVSVVRFGVAPTLSKERHQLRLQDFLSEPGSVARHQPAFFRDRLPG